MNAARKGYRNEQRTIDHYEAMGYACVRSGGSKGAFDIICTGPTDVVMIQVKTNAWPSPIEREAMQLWPAPENARKVCVRWDTRKRVPRVREVWT